MSAQGFRTIAVCILAGSAVWVAAGVAYCSKAHASNFDGPPMAAATASVQRPPEAYQAPAAFTVHTMPSYEIGYLCRDLGGASAAALACTLGQTVYVPNPCEFQGDRYADLLCHEAAHSEGWPANHPRSAQ